MYIVYNDPSESCPHNYFTNTKEAFMFRFYAIVIYTVLFLVFSIPVLGIECIIGKFNKEAEGRQCLWWVQETFKNMVRMAGTKLTVIGEENIPNEPVLYICNHRSYFDILITYARVPRRTGYVSKKEWENYPLLSVWMKRLYCLFLDRDDLRQGMQTILKAVDYIKEGISICIFPEGTRNKGAEATLLPFRAGSFKIAEKSGCPVVPVSINNSAAIYENNHGTKVTPAHVVVEYGKPIYTKDMTREEKRGLSDQVQNIIQETITKNQSLV